MKKWAIAVGIVIFLFCIQAGATRLSLTDGSVKEAIEDADTNFQELYTEIIAARNGETNLLTEIQDIWTAIGALVVGSGIQVSSNDTTPGYLNGKLVAGEGLDLTEGSDGGDETLTVSGEDATTSNKGIASFSSSHFSVSSGAVSFLLVPTVVAKTGAYTLTAADLYGNKLFTNAGAAGEVQLTLPTGVIGMQAEFNVAASQYLRVTAANSENFRYGSELGADNGYIRSTTLGGHWRILFNGTDWLVELIAGSLNYDE